jgi:membrane associated rhomboid family serine protease
MLFLFVFGNTLERRVGHRDYAIIFFAAGIISFLGSLPFFPPDTGMLGASAAIFALAAGVMLVSPLKFSWLFLAPQGLVAIIYFVYNAVIVASSVLTTNNPFGYDPSIAYIAHIIGFTFGIPFGIAWSAHWKKNLLITLGLFGLYLLIVVILAVFFAVKTPFGLF